MPNNYLDNYLSNSVSPVFCQIKQEEFPKLVLRRQVESQLVSHQESQLPAIGPPRRFVIFLVKMMIHHATCLLSHLPTGFRAGILRTCDVVC